jgi:hypothetical protein
LDEVEAAGCGEGGVLGDRFGGAETKEEEDGHKGVGLGMIDDGVLAVDGAEEWAVDLDSELEAKEVVLAVRAVSRDQ